MFSLVNCSLRLAASSVAAPPGPPARYVTASFRTGFESAGRTTTWSPIVRPFGFARFSGTTKVPQRASIPCTMHGLGGHDCCAWPEERSVDADADAGGGHQADEQPHNPLRQCQCSVRGGRLA